MAEIDKEKPSGGAAAMGCEVPKQILPVKYPIKAEHIVLLLILIGGFAFRYLAIDYGLPYQYNWDQPEITGPAMRLLRNGEYQPERFAYGPLNAYMQAAWGVITYVRGLESGEFPDGIYGLKTNRDMGWYWSVTSPFFEREARVLGVIYGCISILAMFGAGRILGGPVVGLWSAAFVAFSTWTRYTSTSVSADSSSGCCVSLALWASCEILNSRARWAYITATIMSGLAISFKYPTFPTVLFPVLAHILSANGGSRPILDFRLVGIFIGVVLTVGLFTFPIFLYPTQFLHDLSTEVSFYGGGTVGDGRGAAKAFLRGIMVSFDAGNARDLFSRRGTMVLIAGLVGAVALARLNWKALVFLLVPALLSIRFISAHQASFYERNLLLPTFAFAPFAGFLWKAFSERGWPWRWLELPAALPRHIWAAIAIACCLLPNFLIQVRDVRAVRNVSDSRVVLSQKMLNDLPPMSRVVVADEARWYKSAREKSRFNMSHGAILRLLNSPPATSETQYLLLPGSVEFYSNSPLRKEIALRVNGFLKRAKSLPGYQFGNAIMGYDRPTLDPSVMLVRNSDDLWRYSTKKDGIIYGMEFDAGGRNDSLRLTNSGIGLPQKTNADAPVRIATTATQMILSARGMARFSQTEPPTVHCDLYKLGGAPDQRPVASADWLLGRTHTGLVDYVKSVKIPGGEYVARIQATSPENYLTEIESLTFK